MFHPSPYPVMGSVVVISGHPVPPDMWWGCASWLPGGPGQGHATHSSNRF